MKKRLKIFMTLTCVLLFYQVANALTMVFLIAPDAVKTQVNGFATGGKWELKTPVNSSANIDNAADAWIACGKLDAAGIAEMQSATNAHPTATLLVDPQISFTQFLSDNGGFSKMYRQ